MKIVFETASLKARVEDDGLAMIAELEQEDGSELFIRLHSWSDTKTHAEMRALIGTRVRVTIESLP